MKFENTNVFNLQGALRGMRFSFDSNHKSDSIVSKDGVLLVGQADLSLASRLATAKGGGHDKFMRQILVSVDISAPEYFWKELDTEFIELITTGDKEVKQLG